MEAFETSPSRPAAIRARRVQHGGQQMQAFGQFQVLDRSAVRTKLRHPAVCRSALATVRRRLVACDGIVAVESDPETGTLVISHSPAFSWRSIGAAAWRLGEPADDAPPAPGAARAAARPVGRPEPNQPDRPHHALGAAVDELVSLVLKGVIARRPAEQIVQDVALGFLAIALRDPRRA
jgi:hypothetical protein